MPNSNFWKASRHNCKSTPIVFLQAQSVRSFAIGLITDLQETRKYWYPAFPNQEKNFSPSRAQLGHIGRAFDNRGIDRVKMVNHNKTERLRTHCRLPLCRVYE